MSALTLPNDLLVGGNWLDASWRVALQMARRAHLPVGVRPVFTYGAYGFLDVRTPFFAEQWLEGVAVGLVVHAALVASVAVLLWRRRASWWVWLAAALPILITLPEFISMDIEADLLAVLLAYLALAANNSRVRVVAAAATGALLGFLLLLKGTGIVIVTGVLLVTIGVMLVQRRGRSSLALVAAFGVVSSGLWWAAGLGPGDVLAYLRGAYEIGAGYSAAMYQDASRLAGAAAAALLAVTAALAVFFALKRRINEAAWFALVFVVGFGFFREDLVREADYRLMLFYAEATFLTTICLVVVSPRLKARREVTRLAAPLVGLTVVATVALSSLGANPYRLENLPARWSSYGTAIAVLLSPSQRTGLEGASLAAARAEYAALLGELQLPAAATVDAMPWDAALFYADSQLHWDPRPVLQSYTAYTPWLDEQDAAFLSGRQAPDYVIYTYETVDNRYEAFDEPGAFRALLQHYRAVQTLDANSVLLQRIGSSDTTLHLEGTVCAELGRAIAVPQLPGRSVFAAVDEKLTLSGRVLDLVDRPSAVAITLTTPTGSQYHRLITAVAQDGLYVSSLLDSASSTADAFRGVAGQPITSLKIDTARALDWQNRVCVTFTSAPATPAAP